MPALLRDHHAARPALVMTLTRDVTELRESQEKLRDSEEKFRLIFEASRDCIMVSRASDTRVSTSTTSSSSSQASPARRSSGVPRWNWECGRYPRTVSRL